jgi:RNA polymerase sigma-70 factor (ECF subfamily)
MELLERFAKGDLDAFEELFRQHQREVFAWILAMIRDRAAAEELTLETFWRVYRSHARFDPARSFGAWARRVATNVALTHLKKTRREVPIDRDWGISDQDHAQRRELLGAIRAAFARLPATLRAVASLALVEEKPYAEIAGALGISLSAVKSREFRAVRLLRADLKQRGIEP